LSAVSTSSWLVNRYYVCMYVMTAVVVYSSMYVIFVQQAIAMQRLRFVLLCFAFVCFDSKCFLIFG
jgi:hypothetical protein